MTSAHALVLLTHLPLTVVVLQPGLTIKYSVWFKGFTDECFHGIVLLKKKEKEINFKNGASSCYLLLYSTQCTLFLLLSYWFLGSLPLVPSVQFFSASLVLTTLKGLS